MTASIHHIIINDDRYLLRCRCSLAQQAAMRRDDPPHILRVGIARLVDGTNAAIRALIAALLAGMCVCALLQVTVRLALDSLGLNLSVPWSEELSRYFMIWLIFLGAAYACRRAQLIALTVVVENIPAPLRRIANVMAALVCIAFYVLLIKVGLAAFRAGFVEMSPVLQFPKAYIYAAMPIGGAVMILNTLACLAESWGWIDGPARDRMQNGGATPAQP
ncbi:MAG: TRAP transporter small permease [Rhodospirillales bacterium]|nr:TRAP transporter small permease [Rhodospirillales bacterium]